MAYEAKNPEDYLNTPVERQHWLTSAPVCNAVIQGGQAPAPVETATTNHDAAMAEIRALRAKNARLVAMCSELAETLADVWGDWPFSGTRVNYLQEMDSPPPGSV